MLLEYILEKNGLTKEDVNIIQNVDFGSTAAAFSSGIADYTVEFEPSATLLEQESAGFVVASLGVESGYVPYTAYCAKKSFLSKNSDVIAAFTRAIQKGLDYCNSHSAEEIAAVIAPQFPENTQNDIAVIVARYQNQDTWKTDPIFKKESLEHIEDIMEFGGELSKRVDFDGFIDNSFAENAVKNI